MSLIIFSNFLNNSLSTWIIKCPVICMALSLTSCQRLIKCRLLREDLTNNRMQNDNPHFNPAHPKPFCTLSLVLIAIWFITYLPGSLFIVSASELWALIFCQPSHIFSGVKRTGLTSLNKSFYQNQTLVSTIFLSYWSILV